jgi:N-methylhydantoinase A
MYRVSIDVGGTFTDLVALDERSGEVINIKTSSIPKNPEKGVINAVEEFLKTHTAESIGMIGHATTIATNALFGQVDLNLPRTGLVTTAGFKDVIEIGRQRRAELYNLFFERPPMLVKRRHRYTISERVSPEGYIKQDIDEGDLHSIIDKIAQDDIESVAVGFINSYANPIHEENVKKAIFERLNIPVTASYEISNEYREYERISTAVVNAVLMPVIHTYITQLESDLESLSLKTQLYVMQSNGGLAKSNTVSQKPATILESGPAAGVIAAAWLGEQTGINNIISFDMGGTTAKAGTVRGRVPEVIPEYEVAGKIVMGRLIKGSGYPIRFPFIDLAECSAGGGTIAKAVNGSLMVGPMSAGAIPGPACYGKGGTDATITDANLILGRLNPSNLLGGAMNIYLKMAREAYAKLGENLGIGAIEAAISVTLIANSMMSKILRIVSVERGYDPRDYALVAFGGAGPMHACALAEELKINKIVIPQNPGMFSALGLLTADLFHDYSRPILSDLTTIDPSRIEMLFHEMEAEGKEILYSESVPNEKQRYQRTLDLRYHGQGFELNIETERPFKTSSIKKAVDGFYKKHIQVYGYAEKDEPIEVVNAKLRVIGLLDSPKLREQKTSSESIPLEKRRVYFETDEMWHNVDIYDRKSIGSEIMGPAVIYQYDSTTVIYPEWSIKPDRFDNLILRRNISD